MKLCREVITVFSARVDSETGDSIWQPTVIRGVSWFSVDASAVDGARGGLTAMNRCTVRIPIEAMPEGLVIRNGDVIVHGDASGMELGPAKLRQSFANAFTVLGVTDNRRAPRAPHLRVVGT